MIHNELSSVPSQEIATEKNLRLCNDLYCAEWNVKPRLLSACHNELSSAGGSSSALSRSVSRASSINVNDLSSVDSDTDLVTMTTTSTAAAAAGRRRHSVQQVTRLCSR